ncbi:unnamed protein product [Callosobruchus maculatus]|uniref:Uncharacterized protein n=1 Tax=Callosobruchus maculatus TaxID=64391 RepID=A0A653C662_CALMS|nr:unnamed protein product [Callosobruchus maculatus]
MRLCIVGAELIHIFRSVPQIGRGSTVSSVHMNFFKYSKSSDMHSYNTQTANTLISDYSRTETSKRNKIDAVLYNLVRKYFMNVNMDILNKFKCKKLIKSLPSDHCFYSTQEFVDFISVNVNSSDYVRL